MTYKLLIIDVDGTILPYGTYKKNAIPSERVTTAIKKASEKLRVCLATGRPYFMVSHILKHLQLSGFAIISDGAQVIDVKTGEVLYEQLLSKEDTLATAAILTSLDIIFYIHDNGKDILYSKDYVPVRPFNIFTTYHIDEAIVDKAVEKLTHIPTLKTNKTHWGKVGKAGILLSHAEATKLHGIFEVAKKLDVKKEEIIGIGDSGNDFQLLMASGLKVAMGNALQDLKDIADYVAPAVNEDGVADVIEKFVLHEKDHAV